MTSHKGYIVSLTQKTIEDKTYIQIFGRLENGKSFAVMKEFIPYFFIRESDLDKVNPLLNKFQTEKTSLTNFKGEKAIKISSPNNSELSKLRSAIHKKTETYEADLTPGMRFIIDNDLYCMIEISGESEHVERVDLFFKDPRIKSIPSESFKPKLKLLSIDLESSKSKDELFCVGLYSENYKKSFILSDKKVDGALNFKTESELLSKFKEEIINFDPDIITGWNLIDFDLVYLKKKFEENKISFDIGRTNESAKLRIEENFFRSSSAQVPGRQVLDGMNLIRDPFIQEAPSIKNKKFESYSLENVSQELLGDGKLIKGKDRHDEIEKLWKTDKKKVIDYNIQDCKLVYDILEKTKIIDLVIERTCLTGIPMNRLTASIIAFDSLYIREARKRGLVSPTTLFADKEERIKGGYVMTSKPGIYHNVLVLDFKSLYPSIIKSFNIDPASHLEKKEKNSVESPNKAYFKNQDGILPSIIEKLHFAREKAKKEKRELSSYAIKIIMNSFFGVLANPGCRYFSLEMANAITHFGQMIIQLTAKKIEEKGYEVIYMDTDSVFIDTKLPKEKISKLGKELQDYINSFYEDFIKKEYNRKSYLELELKKHFLAFMLPKIRSGEAGSKKRYAGLVEKDGKEKIEITGLEAIRGDWTDAAQEFQLELLDKVFHKEDPIKFIKNFVKKLESGKIDNKLVYRKNIRKSLADYTKITPPHVKAARQLDPEQIKSNAIEYLITTEGPEPIQKLKHKIDYEHYIKKQIKPIADTILLFFNKTFDEVIKSSKQTTLF